MFYIVQQKSDRNGGPAGARTDPCAKVTGKGRGFPEVCEDVSNKAEVTVTEREASLCLPARRRPRFSLGLNDPPLHDACVFAAGGDEVAVVTEEVDVGDVTAVAAVHVAGSPELRAGVGEEMHFAEVVPGGQEFFLVGPTGSIDVSSVRAFRPHAEDVEAQGARTRGPLDVSRRFHAYDLLTSRGNPVKDFIVSGIRHKEL